MHAFKRKWLALSLLSGCAIAVSGFASAADIDVASRVAAIDLSMPAAFEHSIAVDNTVLDGMRGGFDIAPGLRVSFGIERMVNLNGILQTATRIEVPEASKLVQLQQSPAASLPNGVGLVFSPASSAPGNAASPAAATVVVPGATISLPVATNLGNGATALIQNGLGNTFSQSAISPESAATFIQNSANNQTIQSLTVINAATNSLELLKGANLQSTLLDALTHSAGMR